MIETNLTLGELNELIIFVFLCLNIFMAHLIGDFLLQNDYMAAHKKQSNTVCTFHVITYMIPFIIISPFFTQLGIFELLLIAVQHWIQDRTQFVLWLMNATFKKQFSEPPLGPWSIFVVDNILHLIWIYYIVLFAIPKLIERM